MREKEWPANDNELAKIAFEDQERTGLMERYVSACVDALAKVAGGEEKEADLYGVDFRQESRPPVLLLPFEENKNIPVDYFYFRSRMFDLIRDGFVSFSKSQTIFKSPEPRTGYLRDFIKIHPGLKHSVRQRGIELKSEPGTLLMITVDRYILNYNHKISACETATATRLDYSDKISGSGLSKTYEILPRSIVSTLFSPTALTTVTQ